MTTGDDLTVRVEFEAPRPTEDVVFSLEIRDEDANTVMRTDTTSSACRSTSPRPGVMHFGIDNMPMLDGSFTFASASRAGAASSTTGGRMPGSSR